MTPPHGLDDEIAWFAPRFCLPEPKASIAPVDTVAETSSDCRQRDDYLCRGYRAFVQDDLPVGRGEIRQLRRDMRAMGGSC
ncbi:hypothetical protein HMP09_2090 [Sphingomonas sp. HMP9]|nr:hypothetical protein HMP09_2090 [Sphingomonas sp. HMP9]